MEDPKAAPTQPACDICGKVPTLTLPIRRHVGMVILQQFIKLQVPLCRTHGVETTRTFLKLTLVQGWWGVVSVFVNMFVVVRDLQVLRRFRGLTAPQPGPKDEGGDHFVGEWRPDHFGRFQVRWFGPDGWTDAVATNGFVSSDPPVWR